MDVSQDQFIVPKTDESFTSDVWREVGDESDELPIDIGEPDLSPQTACVVALKVEMLSLLGNETLTVQIG